MRLPSRRQWQFSDDEGISLIEVMVACVVLSVAVLSVVGAMGSGMGLVGHSRQRTAGAGVAQERLERARNIAYDDLALSEDPTHSGVSGHPDANVIENGPGPEDDQYQLSDSACATPPCVEPLIIDSVDGGLRHLDDPFTLAQTEFTVHQFVTWVDDPSPDLPGTQDYKRVIVVVTWKFPVHSGPKHTVIESTYVTDGTINLPTSSASPIAAPTAAPGGSGENLGVGAFLGEISGSLTPPSNGTGPCTDDVTRPELQSVELLSGSGTHQGYLNSTSVQVRVKARDLECHPLWLYMANKPTRSDCMNATGYIEVQQIAGDSGDPPATVATWTIPTGDGFKALCVVVRNKRNEVSPQARSDVWGVNVKLDQAPPTVPANFREQSCEITANDRVATLSWDPSSDENFNGYRLYRSVEAAPFAVVAQTTSLSLIDNSAKNYASVRYLARAYDKAGNESADSAVVSYAKNRC